MLPQTPSAPFPVPPHGPAPTPPIPPYPSDPVPPIFDPVPDEGVPPMGDPSEIPPPAVGRRPAPTTGGELQSVAGEEDPGSAVDAGR